MLTAEAVTRYIKCNLWSVVLSLLYKNRAIVLELVSVPQFITFGTRTDKKTSDVSNTDRSGHHYKLVKTFFVRLQVLNASFIHRH